MANINWIGTNGDWNDPANWQGGTPPSPTDTADFAPGSSISITGAAYIGTVNVNGANIDLQGDFSGDGVDPSALDDGQSSQPNGTLSVDAWASVAVDTVSLVHTDVVVQGMFANTTGQVGDVFVDGPSAQWLSGQTEVTGTVSVINGGIIAGSLDLDNGAMVTCDNLSTLECGTIQADGSADLSLVQSGSPTSLFAINDPINLSSGATLTIDAADGAAVAFYNGVTGPGTLDLSGENSMNGTIFTLSSNIYLASGTLTAANIAAGTGTISLAQSTLDLRGDQIDPSGSIAISCASGSNTVLGGGGAIMIGAETSSALFFAGGTGAATVTAGAASLTVSGGGGAEEIHAGSGSNDITCGAGNTSVYGGSGAMSVIGGSGKDEIWGGTSGHDTILGGSGSDTLFGGTGASVYAEGAAATVLVAYQANDGVLLDASNSSGADTLYDCGGSGVVTMLGGSGNDIIVGTTGVDSIACGGGNTTVFGGSGVGDTILGGSGSDVLVGGSGATIRIVGAAANAAVSYGHGTLVDASASSGADTIFAAGSGTTTILGGSGADCVVGTTSSMSVIGGSGSLQVWGSPGGYDTILGGSGNDTLLAGSYSQVTIGNAGDNVLIAQGSSSTFDASASTGLNEFFLSGPQDGSNTIRFGDGTNYLVGTGQAAQVEYHGGQAAIWGVGSLDLTVGAADFAGTLNIYQFDAATSTITLPTASYQESESGGNTQILFGDETLVLHGITNLSAANIVVGAS